MNPGQTAPSDLGPYCFQYRLLKNISSCVFLFVWFEVLCLKHGYVEKVSSPKHTFFLGKLD